MKTKVCMITTGHSALDDRIFYKEALSLRRAGFEVVLIAPLNADGFLTDMGGNPIAQEAATLDGIRIIGFKTNSHSIFGLPKTWTISQWLRLATIGRLFLGQDPFSDMIDKATQVDAHIYHCHEIWSLYAALQIKRNLEKRGKKTKLVCDVHEFWPAKSNDGKLRAILWSKIKIHFEKKAAKYVDRFITVNHIIRGHLLILSGFVRTDILYNCPVLSIFKESERKFDNGDIIIAHEGHLPFNRGLREMIEAMNILNNHYNGKVRLLIVGDVFGEERRYLEQKTKEYQIESVVKRTGWLSYEKVGDALSNGTIGIILMDSKEENNMFSSPNKLFNYMRYSIPVVTVDHPELRRIILESQCGIVVKQRNVSSLVSALSMLIADSELRQRLGDNARKAVMEKYNWEIMEKKLFRLYKELSSCHDYVL